AHRRLVHHAVLLTLQPVIEPGQPKAVDVDGSGRPVIDLADDALVDVRRPVDPRPDDQLLVRPGLRHTPGGDALVVNGRAAQEGVEPPAQVPNGRVDLAMVERDRRVPPGGVLARVREPIVERVVDTGQEWVRVLGALAQPGVGLLVGRLQPGAHGRDLPFRDQPVHVRQRDAQRPVHREADLERAAAVGPLAVVVARRLADERRSQMRGAGWQHPVLGDARVRATDRADFAVAPRLNRDPFNRVVAVAVRPPAVVAERVELTLRLEPTAHVLDHHRVAVVRVHARRVEGDLRRCLLVVRGALQERREGPVALGQVDVSVEDRAVPHRHLDVAQFSHRALLTARILPCTDSTHRSPPGLLAGSGGCGRVRGVVDGRILYIHPSKLPVDKPVDWSRGASPYLLAPMGVVGLANALRQKGFDVVGLNYPMEVALDPTFRLVPWLRRQSDVRLAMIDLHWYEHAYGAMDVMRACKHVWPDVPVLLGGLTASRFYDEIMAQFDAVDFLVRGDPE